jgi:hypothetical protein
LYSASVHGRVGQSLNEVKWRYEDTVGQTVDAVEQDDIKFVFTRGAPLLMAVLEQSLNEVKWLYEDTFGHTVDEEVVELDDIKFVVACRAPSSMAVLPA